MLVPKIFTTLQTYDRDQFLADLVAGIVVGIVALPLALAFGIASGVPPDRGTYTALIPGLVTPARGRSRAQHAGPPGPVGVTASECYDGHSDCLIVSAVVPACVAIPVCLGHAQRGLVRTAGFAYLGVQLPKATWVYRQSTACGYPRT